LYRAKRREIGEQVGRLHLVEILRLPQALKPPGAKAPETDPVLRTPVGKLCSLLRTKPWNAR
jgi:hypothetical protein